MNNWMAPCISRIALLTTCLSCVVPAPVDEEVGLVNRPPRIIVDRHYPLITEGPVKLDPCGQDFEAVITDPDLGDTIYYRTFINYHRMTDNEKKDISGVQPVEISTVDEAKNVVFFINPKDDAFQFQAPDSNIHTVELFLSDRPFSTSSVPPIGRQSSEVEALTDSLVWPVYIDIDEECAAP